MEDTLKTLVADTLKLILLRMEDLESTYFQDLGGEVISKTDMLTLLETVRVDILAGVDEGQGQTKEEDYGIR
jgi:hypothetical protein